MTRKAKGTLTYFANPGQAAFDIDVKHTKRAAVSEHGCTVLLNIGKCETKGDALNALDAVRRNIENNNYPR